MRKSIMLIWIAGIVLFGFGAFVAYLYLNQQRMLFYPTASFETTPEDCGLEYQEIWITSANDRQVHAWYFPGQRPEQSEGGGVAERPLVLFCHGNAGNISHRLETAEYLVGLGAAVVLFDYAGYGRSEGRPSEENTYADALAAYQWVLRETGFEADRVVIMGRSLGGAVAIDLAARVAARGLIVESAFTSALDMGRRMFPFVPVAWLLRHHFDALSKIGVVNCPVLIVHSVDDEMIPYEMGQQLFQSARPPKQMVTISGSHNNREYFDNEEYRAAVGQVLKGATPSQREP